MALYRDRDLKQLSKEITDEGVGIGGGFILAGAVGRQVENMIKKDVNDTSPMTDKVMAWMANNGGKALLYVLAKQYDTKSGVTKEATKAIAGSIVYDTVLRVANHGYNPADVGLSGYRILSKNTGSTNSANVHKLIQENSVLRTELNKALQKLAGIPKGYGSVAPDPMERQRKFGSMPIAPAIAPAMTGHPNAMPTAPNISERQRKYGAMPFEQHPVKTARERMYGFMSYPPSVNNIAFGMH